MKKCFATNRPKTKFPTEKEAGRAMMRTWAHVTTLNIYDMHTYLCDACGHWHFGHKSYYEAKLNKQTQENIGA